MITYSTASPDSYSITMLDIYRPARVFICDQRGVFTAYKCTACETLGCKLIISKFVTLYNCDDSSSISYITILLARMILHLAIVHEEVTNLVVIIKLEISNPFIFCREFCCLK